ncbi:MAG: carboxymuconolactone decarboxylase family protein [Acidobacteriaceae bacterium]
MTITRTEPRLPRVKRSEAPESVAALFDHYMQTRGNIPNMFRTIALRPEIFETMIAHFQAILNTGTLPVKLKELVIVRTSQLNECRYCLGSHTQICRKLGWSDDQIENLAHYAHRDDFTPAEKAALRLAEEVTLNSNGISDTFFAEVRSHYSDGEIIELLSAIGLFNYFNRVNNALQLEPTKPGEGAE